MTNEEWARSMVGQVKYVIYEEISDSYLTDIDDMTWCAFWLHEPLNEVYGMFEYLGRFEANSMFDSVDDARSTILGLELDPCEEWEFEIQKITFGIQSHTFNMESVTPICTVEYADRIYFEAKYNEEEPTTFQSDVIDILTSNFSINYDLNAIAYKLETELKNRGYKL